MLFSFLLLIEVLGYGMGVVEITTPALTSARAHTHVFITFYTAAVAAAAAASARSSISSPFVAKGCGGRSNTPGPRCLNSGPETLICAYQSETDNPWHSSPVNQVQIECRLRPIAFVAGDNDICTHYIYRGP